MKPQSLTFATVLVAAALAVAAARGQGMQITEQAGGYGMAPDGAMGSPGMYEGGDAPPPMPPGPGPFGLGCRHYLRLESMLLDRNVDEGLRLTSQGVGGDLVLATDQLEFAFEAVTRVVLGLRLTDCCVVEGTFYGLQNWEDRAHAADSGGQLFSIYSDFGTDPPLGFGNTDQALVHEIHYTSELLNAELNFSKLCRGQIGCGNEVWCLAGLRYVEIQEGFDYLTITGVDRSFTNVRTENHMVAFQMGLRYDHQVCCKLRVSTEVKAGVAVNMADLDTETNATIPDPLTEHESADEVAFLGETSLTGVYDICRWLCVRGGYHLLYVDGVALAPDNFDRTPPASGARVPIVDLDGSVLYHGVTAGVELHW